MDRLIASRWFHAHSKPGYNVKVVPSEEKAMYNQLKLFLVSQIHSAVNDFSTQFLAGFLIGVWYNGELTGGALVNVMTS